MLLQADQPIRLQYSQQIKLSYNDGEVLFSDISHVIQEETTLVEQ
jgi:hypothetical protein